MLLLHKHGHAMSFENAGLLLAFMDGAMLKELVGMMSAQAWRAAAVSR